MPILTICAFILVSAATAAAPVWKVSHAGGCLYTGDDEITKHLKAETVEKLESYLQSQNLTLEPFKKMKPGFLSIMLVNVELQRLGMTESGVYREAAQLRCGMPGNAELQHVRRSPQDEEWLGIVGGASGVWRVVVP